MTSGVDISSGFLSGSNAKMAARWQRGRVGGSFLLHVAIVGALLLPTTPPPPDPPLPPGFIMLVPVPPLPKVKQTPVRKPPVRVDERPQVAIRAPVDPSKVDASGASFEVHYPAKHLFDVIASFGATLGFVRTDRPAYITARFRPPDWAPVNLGSERKDDFVALRIQQPYPFVDRLRARYRLENCAAYVLFDETFRDRITAALQEQAAQDGKPGQVLSAKVMLSYNPAGVHIVMLRMAGETSPQQ